MPSALLQAATGHWAGILAAIAGLSPDQLSDRHQPCPLCGGTDRYRFDDLDGSGSWFCNQCGGKDQRGGAGSGIDLLMRATGLSFPDACRRIEAHLGLPSIAAPAKPGKPYRRPLKPPADAPPPPLDRGAIAQWCYRDSAGDPLFWIQRIRTKRGRAFIHRVWLDDAWHRPSKADGFTCSWPTPRPLLNLDQLAARPDAPVLVVEGEKAADAAAAFFPLAVVTTWSNGSKSHGLVDWGPLHGRTLILWPDNDDEGRQAMNAIAAALHPFTKRIEIVANPADAPDGWDVADATWSPAEAQAHLKASRSRYSPPAPEPQPEPAPAPEPQTAPQPTGNFACLGFDGDGYFYQPHATGQVIRLSRSAHTGTNLVALAPLAYWETLYPGKSGPNWTSAASDLFAQQSTVGVYDPARIRGRGAWWDANRSILHLGDRLIVDGATHPITAPPPSDYSYQRLARIDLSHRLQPLTPQQGTEILDIASRFHWEVPASGLLLAGWVALAPICGSLSWRPHIWLTASAGSGKSAILDRFLGTLLDTFALWPEGNTTEAFIRQELRADALPVVMDEAESNEQADRIRIQSILALARVASSSGRGVIGKGSSDGAAQRFTIRSMFLLCSISTALKQGADKSRFAQLTLRNPAHLPKDERTAHWKALDRDLETVITQEIGQRMLLRSVALIPVIRQAASIFRRAAADRFDSQRHGDQYGTLLAGAWSLMNDHPPTDAEAYALIDQNDWEPYREATETPDEQRCIQHILQHQLRIEVERTYHRTIGELVEIASGIATSMEIASGIAEAHLGRHGIRADADTLLISNTAVGLRKILQDTPWADCWPTILSRLPGAQKAGVVRFRGLSGVSRAVAIPTANL